MTAEDSPITSALLHQNSNLPSPSMSLVGASLLTCGFCFGVDPFFLPPRGNGKGNLFIGLTGGTRRVVLFLRFVLSGSGTATVFLSLFFCFYVFY